MKPPTALVVVEPLVHDPMHAPDQEVRSYFLLRDEAGSKWPPIHKV